MNQIGIATMPPRAWGQVKPCRVWHRADQVAPFTSRDCHVPAPQEGQMELPNHV